MPRIRWIVLISSAECGCQDHRIILLAKHPQDVMDRSSLLLHFYSESNVALWNTAEIYQFIASFLKRHSRSFLDRSVVFNHPSHTSPLPTNSTTWTTWPTGKLLCLWAACKSRRAHFFVRRPAIYDSIGKLLCLLKARQSKKAHMGRFPQDGNLPSFLSFFWKK